MPCSCPRLTGHGDTKVLRQHKYFQQHLNGRVDPLCTAANGEDFDVIGTEKGSLVGDAILTPLGRLSDQPGATVPAPSWLLNDDSCPGRQAPGGRIDTVLRLVPVVGAGGFRNVNVNCRMGRLAAGGPNEYRVVHAHSAWDS